MNLYCVYRAMSKSPEQLSNCLKIIETRVVLIFFNGVLCEVLHLYCYRLHLYMNQVPEKFY